MNKLGGWIFLFFTKICHQIPERSFSCYGHTMAVCARCAGIYYGSFAGAILFPLFAEVINIIESKTRMLFGVACFPIIIDVLFTRAGIINSSNVIRHITGLFSGLIVSIILLNLIFNNTNKNKEVD